MASSSAAARHANAAMPTTTLLSPTLCVLTPIPSLDYNGADVPTKFR